MKKLLASLGVLSLLIVGSVHAEDTASDEFMDFACAIDVADTAEVELEQYMSFLTQLFDYAEDSSLLVDEAMAYYRTYKSSIEDKYDEVALDLSASSFEGVYSEFEYCKSVRDSYLQMGEVLLQAHAVQSANSKRSYAIVDGMKVINENMATLSENFNRVFPASFQTMENALPCYVRECVSQ